MANNRRTNTERWIAFLDDNILILAVIILLCISSCATGCATAKATETMATTALLPPEPLTPKVVCEMVPERFEPLVDYEVPLVDPDFPNDPPVMAGMRGRATFRAYIQPPDLKVLGYEQSTDMKNWRPCERQILSLTIIEVTPEYRVEEITVQMLSDPERGGVRMQFFRAQF